MIIVLSVVKDGSRAAWRSGPGQGRPFGRRGNGAWGADFAGRKIWLARERSLRPAKSGVPRLLGPVGFDMTQSRIRRDGLGSDNPRDRNLLSSCGGRQRTAKNPAGFATGGAVRRLPVARLPQDDVGSSVFGWLLELDEAAAYPAGANQVARGRHRSAVRLGSSRTSLS
jgi:hypothetical protein